MSHSFFMQQWGYVNTPDLSSARQAAQGEVSFLWAEATGAEAEMPVASLEPNPRRFHQSATAENGVWRGGQRI